jgi:protocatechuate 3,4-dioxygenase alpha subunit
MAERTPSQTIGPFFHVALPWSGGGTVGFVEEGPRIVLTGSITDGAGNVVGDALVETWQHSPKGATPACATGERNPHGFGRVETAKDGTFRIETSMPGGDVPCLDVAIFARGLLKPLRTRVYLTNGETARKDAVLKSLGDSARIATLVAASVGAGEFRWDVRLQGEGETVFFAA